MPNDDVSIVEAARFIAHCCGRETPDASDFRAVAKAIANRLAEVTKAAKDVVQWDYTDCDEDVQQGIHTLRELVDKA
jgi:hypothetical protein